MSTESWPQRAANALELAPLSEEQVAMVLDLARDVAHGTERRFAPLTTFLAGVAVGRSEGQTLDEVVATLGELLEP